MRAIGGAFNSTCAVMDSGAAECWGTNSRGTLGNGTTADSSTPVPVQLSSDVRVTAIAGGGGYHTCALTSEGGVLCWGLNSWGQLGDGTETGPQTCGASGVPCSTVPVAVPLPEGVTATAIATGGYHTCALTSEGGAFCWGRNNDGELGDGTTADSSTPVAVQLPMGVRVTAIASEEFHTCALTSEGGVLCWGQNFDGELGDGTDEGPETCGPGEIPCSTVPVAVNGLDGSATAVATGGEYSCAAMEAGGVECWGYSRNGALGNGHAYSLTPVQVIGLMWSLSVSTSGGGAGTVASDPTGIDCGGAGQASCGALFAPGTAVALRATPAPGSGFVGFAGGGCGGSGLTCQVPMGSDQSVTATFEHLPRASISAPAGGRTYTVGQPVATRFGCAEGAGGPGLSSCADSTGTSTASGGQGHLDTSTAGRHTYTAVATSEDGLTDRASIGYSVAPSAPPSAPVPGAPGPRSPALRILIRSRVAPLAHRRARVRLRCGGGGSGSICRGTLELLGRTRRGARPRRQAAIVLGRARYAIPAGQSGVIAVKVRKVVLRLLEHTRRHLLRARAVATVRGGRPVHRTVVLTRAVSRLSGG